MANPNGRLGPSLKRFTGECTPREKGPRNCGGFTIGDTRLVGRGITLEALAAELTITGRPVADRTGLTGLFDIDIQWPPDELGVNGGLFTALRQELGLKLESTRLPVEVIVIDGASQPSEN